MDVIKQITLEQLNLLTEIERKAKRLQKNPPKKASTTIKKVWEIINLSIKVRKLQEDKVKLKQSKRLSGGVQSKLNLRKDE